MAYFRSEGYDATPNNAANTVGKHLRVIPFGDTITTGNHAAGDTFILAGPLGYDDKVEALNGILPALTGATDSDLGFFYKKSDGTFAELDKDILWDGVSLASAAAYNNQLIGKNSSLDLTKNIGALLGKASDSEPVGGVFLGLTLNNKSTAASVRLDLQVQVSKATTE